MHRNRADLALGLGAVVLAILAISVWVPNDSATWIIEKVRGRLTIGDAMAPVAAFVLVAISGALIVFEGRKADAAPEEAAPQVSRGNLVFIAMLGGVFILSIALMRWTGPALVALFGPEGESYRSLRDTMPWKLSGFVVGGTFLVAGIMALTQHRLRWTYFAVGLMTVAGLIVVFDLPFPDLLLPPNGDL